MGERRRYEGRPGRTPHRQWNERMPEPRRGCRIPGMRHWLLRDASGRPAALAFARTEADLPWHREGVPPGWRAAEVPATTYDHHAARGVPVRGREENA